MREERSGEPGYEGAHEKAQVFVGRDLYAHRLGRLGILADGAEGPARARRAQGPEQVGYEDEGGGDRPCRNGHHLFVGESGGEVRPGRSSREIGQKNDGDADDFAETQGGYREIDVLESEHRQPDDEGDEPAQEHGGGNAQFDGQPQSDGEDGRGVGAYGHEAGVGEGEKAKMEGGEGAHRQDGVYEESIQVRRVSEDEEEIRQRHESRHRPGQSPPAERSGAHARSADRLPRSPFGLTIRMKNRMRKAMASLMSLPPGT